MSHRYSRGIPEKGYPKPGVRNPRPETPCGTENPGPLLTWWSPGPSTSDLMTPGTQDREKLKSDPEPRILDPCFISLEIAVTFLPQTNHYVSTGPMCATSGWNHFPRKKTSVG